jgi:methionyl-tRNA formyltransferase
LKLYPNIKGEKQQGDASFTKKRKPEDSEFNINKTIKEQFNLFRIVDNKNYPAFFIYKGSKYILSIKKEK